MEVSDQSSRPEHDFKCQGTLLQAIHRHVVTTLGNDVFPPRKETYYKGLAYAVRDRLMERWVMAQRDFYDQKAKRVYYLSMEYLPGRFLMNYITNLELEQEVEAAIKDMPFTLQALEEEEWDAGLGNGGLGRLASCFMDSMATLKIPGYGYGLRYDYGIFFQKIVNGYQVEKSDNWIRNGFPWEIKRTGFLYDVNFYGRSQAYIDSVGETRYRWVDTQQVHAMACDIMIPGYGTKHVNNMRLWESVSDEAFSLTHFNDGDYTGAMQAKVREESITKVLYPSDEKAEGRELRLKQQYFMVAATLHDIFRRFKKKHGQEFQKLPDQVAIQLNDTHPSIAVAEFMRRLLDEEMVGWDQAWEIAVKTFAYTNHTVLPEALETWPVELLGRLLPRHLEIIYEINHRFLEMLRQDFPHRPDLQNKLSIIKEGPTRLVRMAHLAIIGSHAVNGVAELHSRIIRESLFRDFNTIYPDRLTNVTNGITPRRWLRQANPELSQLISQAIGDAWIADLDQLKRLIPLADDAAFQQQWIAVKRIKKQQLSAYIQRKLKFSPNPDALFDVQVKRIHEYKRQLLTIMHGIALYRRLLINPQLDMVPRTIILAGKAAPAYHLAKNIIKLANAVAEQINNNPICQGKLSMAFLPNYCISQAEKVIPGADLSEQISTAGMEASGTGNMKFALNGALTIGTLDGANVEIMEEVGAENIFIFGLTSEEVEQWREGGLYNPRWYVERDEELRGVLQMISSDTFCPGQPGLFEPIRASLLERGDYYMVIADFRAYLDRQQEVAETYRNTGEWARRSILNTANMGKFSSDRAIREYARNIWDVEPLR
ncbi:glycogen phosphorylase [Magnetococcus marinus MC-1]|uniref:Alpha-1,4 glucan phosphorylase n=1 Tax=Magnetococcus marinus (strain ATCC BAA-1437 / JCM 17883 / MC-1) TaxID=156889 RepID=A0LD78_MAGMM|nr:glycogen/starch/alpha-glucan phosphorylase [Magnetococcus marinus]ABK45921.1 glycogen phosphorylase [Magnetococcus marinus MC-1]